jgi:hypothetical protein
MLVFAGVGGGFSGQRFSRVSCYGSWVAEGDGEGVWAIAFIGRLNFCFKNPNIFCWDFLFLGDIMSKE